MSNNALYFIFFLLPICLGNKLNYEIGSTLSYSLNTVTDTRGFLLATNEQTSGSVFTVTGTVVMTCIDKPDDSFIFALNLKDTFIHVDSNTEEVGDEQEASVEEWLGEDMFFQQHENGQIIKVWYNDTEDPFVMGVKVGVISNLQTNLLATTEKVRVTEHDALGQHTSIYSRDLQGRSAVIRKTFSEIDFKAYADDDLQLHNVKVDGKSSILLSESGILHTISSVHQVIFDNVVDDPYVSDVKGEPSESIDLKFTSYGSTKLVMTGQRNLLSRSTFIPPGLASGTLFDVSARVIDIQESTSDDSETIEEDVYNLINTMDATQSVFLTRKITENLLNNEDNTKQFVRTVLSKNMAEDINVLSKVLPILVQLKNREAQNFVYQLLWSENEPYQILAIQSMMIVDSPPSSWASTLLNLYSTSTNENVKNMAILAVGSIMKNNNQDSAEKIANSIQVSLGKAMASGDIKTTRLLAYVLQNAAVAIPQELHSNLTMLFADPNYPFAKSWKGSTQLGGSSINLVGTAEVMAGTNFNCKQPTFNYKVFGQAEAIATLFGHSKTAFHAHVVYGKANGASLENEILVKAWDKVLYHKSLPSLDCVEHTYPLVHTAPGFSVKYTVFVSVVPVTFSAGANLVFDLKWGWQVCDAQLGALVELIPKTTLVVHGSASINLFLIKGGVELSGSFNVVIKPQGYIHGSTCALGFQVLQQNDPMTVNFLAYYQTRKCKIRKLRCSWGSKHSVNIFHFGIASNNKALYKQEFAIKK